MSGCLDVYYNHAKTTERIWVECNTEVAYTGNKSKGYFMLGKREWNREVQIFNKLHLPSPPRVPTCQTS